MKKREMTSEILRTTGVILVLMICAFAMTDWELLNYIDDWGDESVTNQELLEAIDNWAESSSEGSQVTVIRDMPSTALAGNSFIVSLLVDINESNAPNGIIIDEYIPVGWSVTDYDESFEGFDPETGHLRFLLYGSMVADKTINYAVTIDNATGNATFSGILETRNRTANISGDTTILVSTYAATANRTLPETAPAGSSVNVSISLDVNETGKPNSVIVKDYFPAGWDVTSSVPIANSVNSSSGEIKWILTGDGVVDRVVSYVIEIPSGEIGNRTFSGELLYNDPEGNPVTVGIGGDSTITIEGECPTGDADCDGAVSDFELLDYVDQWVQGSVSDFDLLEAIDNWAS